MTARRDASHSPERQLLKREFKRLVQDAGGVDAASLATSRSMTQLSAYGNINAPEFPPINVIDDLEQVTVGAAEWPRMTRLLCRSRGGVFLKLPTSEAGSTEWHRAIGSISKEVGEVIQPVCEALADGKVTATEIRGADIRRQIAEAQERLALLDALCAQAEEEGE